MTSKKAKKVKFTLSRKDMCKKEDLLSVLSDCTESTWESPVIFAFRPTKAGDDGQKDWSLVHKCLLEAPETFEVHCDAYQ